MFVRIVTNRQIEALAAGPLHQAGDAGDQFRSFAYQIAPTVFANYGWVKAGRARQLDSLGKVARGNLHLVSARDKLRN